MPLQTTVIPSTVDSSSTDNETLDVDSNDKLRIKPEYEDAHITTPNAEQDIEIIELQANASVTPLTHDSLVSEAFSDVSGYNNYVNTGNSTAVFNTNKYERGKDGSLVGYWKFEDLLDFTDNNLDLTHSGTPTYAAGKLSNGLDLESTSSEQARITGVTGSLLAGVRTVDLWIKAETVTGRLLCIHKSADLTNRLEFQESAGKLYILLKIGNVIQWELTTTTSIPSGSWMHIVLVMGTGGAKVYIDGNTTPEDTDADTTTMDSNFTVIEVGSYDGTQGYFDGIIDNLALFSSLYGIDEVTNSYNSGNGKVHGGTAGDQIVEIDLPIIIGTITHTQLLVNDPERESGDAITYDIVDSVSASDTSQALDTKNTLTTPDGTKISGGKIKINLEPKASSPTDGYPSVKSFAFKLWKL